MDILVGRHIKGKLALKDTASFVHERWASIIAKVLQCTVVIACDYFCVFNRAALEEAYARSLSKLANTTFSIADHSDG